MTEVTTHSQLEQLLAFEQTLHRAFGFDGGGFGENTSYFYASKECQDISETMQEVSHTVGETIFLSQPTPKPSSPVLIEGAVAFTARAAQEMKKQRADTNGVIFSFWGNIARAIVAAEYAEEKDGAVLYHPVTAEGRIYRNRGVGDRVIQLFNSRTSES